MVYAVGLVLLAIVGVYGIFLGLGHLETPSFLMERRMTVMASSLMLLAAFDTGAMWAYWGTATPQQATRKTESYLLPKVLAKVLTAKLKLPHQVTSRLWIETIQSHNDVLTYTFSVTANDIKDFEAIVADAKAGRNAGGCKQEEYTIMLKHGVTIEFDFHTPERWDATPYILTPASCGF